MNKIYKMKRHEFREYNVNKLRNQFSKRVLQLYCGNLKRTIMKGSGQFFFVVWLVKVKWNTIKQDIHTFCIKKKDISKTLV